MSRATPDLTQGFDGVSLPKTGPRQMGTDADGRTSVISFLNQVTESAASLHDNQTDTRPDYLPVNGLWCYTAPDGTKTVYQYDGTTDVELWTVAPDGTYSITAGISDAQNAADTAQATANAKLDTSVYEGDADSRFKAWAVVEKTGVVRISKNVSSVVRRALGRYTVNSPLIGANSIVLYGIIENTSSLLIMNSDSGGMQNGSFFCQCGTPGGVYIDAAFCIGVK